MMTNHDEYWKQVKADSEEYVEDLFDEGGSVSLADVLGHGSGLTSRKDAKSALAYVLKHGDACETACAILALGDWMHACNELQEHDGPSVSASSSAAAGAAAK